MSDGVVSTICLSDIIVSLGLVTTENNTVSTGKQRSSQEKGILFLSCEFHNYRKLVERLTPGHFVSEIWTFFTMTKETALNVAQRQ